MWYVCTLAEVTGTGSYTFGDIYWGGKKVVFDGTDTAKVVQLETNSDPIQIDDQVNGKIYIYKFPNGSSSGISTGGSNAITLLSDASIPSDQRWNGPIYTTGGESATMSNTAFVIVKVLYDTNANTTRLEQMSVELTNSLSKPGDVLNDYMTNIRYGCAISSSDIDSTSITTLNTYSDELITYTPVGGGSATQARYRINGPVNTGQNCLNNLQELVDACDSWLQYSELTGKWTIVVNKPYDWDGTTLAQLYQVSDSVLISGINVNPIDLNNAYNQLEVQFPDKQVNDQTNYNVINLIDFAPEVMSPNEPENKLTVQFPQVNNYIQSTYLGVRRMLQSREDLVIDCLLDYSGIQVVAGDVICVPFAPYGWEAFNSGYGKLFRVSQVQEAKLDDGSLGARITAFEYNATVYADDPIQDYVAESNTGLTDPNIFDVPGTPVITTNTLANSGAVTSFTVTSTVPATGTTVYMDFNYGNTNNVASHTSYSSSQLADGTPYTNGQTVSIEINDLPIGNYYFSTTARNDIAGRASLSSTQYNWTANLQANSVTYTNMSNSVAVSSFMGGFSYSVSQGGTVTIPVDVASRATPNEPYYIDGTTVGSSYYYPYFQGTSSTANGYQANSTASFTPALATDAAITNGQNNWWIHQYLMLASPISNVENILLDITSTFVSNVDTTIQITPMLTFTTGSEYVYDDQFTATLQLKANQPIKYQEEASYSGTTSIDGAGFLIRNMVTGSRLYSVYSTLALYREKQ
jgi:hypothetical protein